MRSGLQEKKNISVPEMSIRCCWNAITQVILEERIRWREYGTYLIFDTSIQTDGETTISSVFHHSEEATAIKTWDRWGTTQMLQQEARLPVYPRGPSCKVRGQVIIIPTRVCVPSPRYHWNVHWVWKKLTWKIGLWSWKPGPSMSDYQDYMKSPLKIY